MSFYKLSANSKALLDALISADNPTEELCKRWTSSSGREFSELQSIVRELRELKFINVRFAGDKPYIVSINNSARTYNERLAEYETEKSKRTAEYNINQSITIGDGNTFKNSNICGSNNNIKIITSSKKGFIDKHPYLTSLIISLIAGFILMFSFWTKIIQWIEAIM